MQDDWSEPAERAAAYALVVLLALLTGLWGAFLVPLRIDGVAAPVSVVLAAVANAALGWAGGRLYGRLGAGVPGLLWLVVAVLAQARRPEGDLVVPATVTGLLFLVVGSLSAAVPVGLAPSRRRLSAEPSSVVSSAAAGVGTGT